MNRFDLYYTKEYMRYDILNMLIKKYDFKKYLEVGVADGQTFSRIECDFKISVDPLQNGYTTYQMYSDDFFANLDKDDKFDIIFVDGLHKYEQCYKDLENSINHLEDNGFLLCHDMNPYNRWLARPELVNEETGDWNGDVYKSFIKFRQNHFDCCCCMLYDCDWGIGVIKKGIGQKIICDVDNLTYEEFANNKNYLMNCISVYDFIKCFC